MKLHIGSAIVVTMSRIAKMINFQFVSLEIDHQGDYSLHENSGAVTPEAYTLKKEFEKTWNVKNIPFS